MPNFSPNSWFRKLRNYKKTTSSQRKRSALRKNIRRAIFEQLEDRRVMTTAVLGAVGLLYRIEGILIQPQQFPVGEAGGDIGSLTGAGAWVAASQVVRQAQEL